MPISGSEIRKIILEQSKRAHVGHIGSCLSIADIVATLYGRVLRIDDPDDPERDRFVLSKGHAALTVYAALYLRSWIDDDQLAQFHGDLSLLGVHPEHGLRGIDFCTGSLGQGLSMATGAALAARLQDSSRRVFVLVSDAECNEGALWEAAMFAGHHRLSQLIAIVDDNGQQALGYTRDVLDQSQSEARWRSFGWDVHVCDGHDVSAMETLLQKPTEPSDAPKVILARTVFGKGVSYMERSIKWHHWPMSDEEYRQAMAEIGFPL